MTGSQSRSPLARHWELLKLLPTRGAGKSARELAGALVSAGYTVSKRQVERDLQELGSLFAVHCNDAGMPYGWRWADNASVDFPGLTIADALSLKLVEASLRPLLPPAIQSVLLPRFHEAERKLAALESSNTNARWTHKVRVVSPGLNLQKISLDATLLTTIQECLLHDEQVEVAYRAGDGKKTTSLRLHPLALVTRGPATYLIATAFDYADVRRYALHRFVSATRKYEASRRPDGFDIDAYLQAGGMEFGNGTPVRLRARISPALANVLAESPLSDDQTLAPEGERFLLQATHADSWQLRWWLLSQGDGVEILEPSELRQQMVDTLQNALARYDVSPTEKPDASVA